MRLIVVLSMAGNLLIVGPFEVGIPALAYTRLPEGAAAFGLMASAFGLGSLVGLGAAAGLPKPRPGLFAAVALGSISISGLLLAAMSLVYATPPALIICLFIGVGLGFSNLLTLTWVQRRVPGTLMGRVMSLMMLGSLGLVPVSIFLAGIVVQVNLSGLLIFGGIGMMVLCLGSLASVHIRRMGYEPEIDDDAAPLGEGAAPAAA